MVGLTVPLNGGGAPGVTRTRNLPLRRRVLYPVELPEHDACHGTAQILLWMQEKGRCVGGETATAFTVPTPQRHMAANARGGRKGWER